MLIAAAVAFATTNLTRPEPWGPNTSSLEKSNHVWRLARAKIEARRSDPWLQRVMVGSVQSKVIRHGPQDKLEMAITIDDGPHGQETWEMLRMLDEVDAKATFFVVGKMLENRHSLIGAMTAAGHEIANHTFSHPNLANLGTEDVLTEYKAANMAIQGITGHQPKFCRPPGGRLDPTVLKAASALGMTTVYWNANPGDYKFDDPDEILTRLRAKRAPGAIVLVHSGLMPTVDALRMFVLESKAMGYRFVLLDEWVKSEKKRPAVLAEPKSSVWPGKVPHTRLQAVLHAGLAPLI